MSTYFQLAGRTMKAIYIDISAGSNGDGVAPGTPFNTLPTTIADGDAWILRRTAYNASGVETSAPYRSIGTLITKTDVTCCAIIGCPRTAAQSPKGIKSMFYDIVPAEVITAWGADAAQWAYLPTSVSGGAAITLSTVCCDMILDGIKAYRTNGVAGTNAMFNLSGSNTPATYSNKHSNVYVGECLFGQAGIPIEDVSYNTAVATNSITNFIAVADGGTVVIDNATFNEFTTAGSQSVVLVNTCWKTSVNNTTLNRLSRANTGVSTYALAFNTTNTHKCIHANFSNITDNVIVNASNAVVGGALQLGGGIASAIDYLTMRNWSTTMPRTLGTIDRAGTNLTITNSCNVINFYAANVSYFDIEDVTINLNKIWNFIAQNGQVFSMTARSGVRQTIGAIRRIKNFTIQMGEDPDVAYGTSNYDNTDVDDVRYFAFLLNANLDDAGNNYVFIGSGCPIIIDNLTVNNERGKAAYINAAQVSNSTFKGTTVFGPGCKADVISVSSWFPGSFIKCAHGANVHVATVTAKTDNTSYPYTSQTVLFGYTNADQMCIVVDSCNTALTTDNKATSETSVNRDYSMICKSALTGLGNSNFFMADSYNMYARSTNIYRTGGAAAGVMFINSFVDNVSPMILGKAPMLGAQVAVPSAGRYRLSYYVCAKNYADMTQIRNRFKIKVRVPQNAAGDLYADYYSDVCGAYNTDASTWNNETGLTKWRVDLYLNCPYGPLDVEFEFNWYGAAGCKFVIDPQAELVATP